MQSQTSLAFTACVGGLKPLGAEMPSTTKWKAPGKVGHP